MGWIPGDKRRGNPQPQEPLSCRALGKISPCSVPSRLQILNKAGISQCGSEPLAKRVPEPAISSKNCIILRNHRVAPHKSQIIQTRWEKWGNLRHFEAFQLLLKQLPREVSQHFWPKLTAANPDPDIPSQLNKCFLSPQKG